MMFAIKDMEESEAYEISEWHYEEPYSFYDFRADLDDTGEFLDFSNRPGNKYFSVIDESGVLVGFFEFNSQNAAVEIGLGMRPDLTGRGLGLSFVVAGLDFARERFSPDVVILKVVYFNKRALKVYERAGFKVTGKVFIENDLGKHEFIEMEFRT